ncbi:hypothetical protein ACQP08_01465 [Micromonospora zamorensis]
MAAPFGMLIGALLPREMEGTLLLLVVGVAAVVSVRLRRRRHLRHLPVG